MPTMTALQAAALRRPGRYRAAETLYLRVQPNGRKSWLQRVLINGRRRDIGLGPFDLVSLAQARKKARANRIAILEGRDPLADRTREQIPTFREAALKVIAMRRPGWRNAKHAAQWETTLETYAFPFIGNYLVSAIRPGDVLRVLRPIWNEKPETARRVRQRIRTVLAWAEAHGFVNKNVAGEGIDAALPRRPKTKTHFRALPYAEVPSALAVVEASGASFAARLCLRFLVLTATRSGEARGARWSEMDLRGRKWVIPPERTKTGTEHRIPLSPAALVVLARARVLEDRGGRDGLVFPGRVRGRELSNMALTKLLRDNDLATRGTVHGFRSSFADWAAEHGMEALADAALAHVQKGVKKAYFRTKLFEQRRPLMDAWGEFVAA